MDILEKIESLESITTYCFFLDRNKFFLILYIDANPESSQYNSGKEISIFTQIFEDFLERDTPTTADNT